MNKEYENTQRKIKNIFSIMILFSVINLVGCTHYYEKHCNLFSTDEGVICSVALLGSLPVGVLKYSAENKKEESREQDFIANRNAGVVSGNRSALENCAQFCHMSSQDSAEQIALSKLAFEKLIQLDDPKVEMTTDQIKAMITAYSNLQHKLSFSNPLKAQYVKRSWDLTKQVSAKGEYSKIEHSSGVIGAMAYLFHNRLIDQNIQNVKPIFNQCMSDQFWINAHFNRSSLYVMEFCQVALNWYISTVPTKDRQEALKFKEQINSTWRKEWEATLNHK